MSGIKDFADQLQQDVVCDMAESYFGVRKNLEDMITAFEQMVAEFRTMVERLSEVAATLHWLLLDEDTARGFYIALDILPSCIPFSQCPTQVCYLEGVPFAFTAKGRYMRCVLKAYGHLQTVSDQYLNGTFYNDPDCPGRKRLTIHYLRLRAMSEYINEHVKKVNAHAAPSEMLQYIKRMNPEAVEREEVMGGGCQATSDCLDTGMRFSAIDFEALGFPEVQELPHLSVVRGTIREFCADLYAARRKDVSQVLNAVRRGKAVAAGRRSD